MSAKLLVSSYAASPAHGKWNPTLEADFLAGLRALPGVVGLEVPWVDGLHPHDEEWFLAHVPFGTELAITPLPWVMRRSGEDARYGIASADRDGRAVAVADLRRVLADVVRINEDSAASVALVELHTAPHTTADAEALARTLDEISTWDWQGARLVIEHCDAFIPGQAYEKGFLSLADEIAAIEQSQAPVGLWLNWGRSAIELREGSAVTEQIATSAASGRLVGLGFSGAGFADGPYGGAWVDAHLPIHESHPEAHSLLTADLVTEGLRAAGDIDWLALKVSRRPGDDTAAAALSTVAHNFEIFSAQRTPVSSTPSPAASNKQLPAGNRRQRTHRGAPAAP